MPPTPTFAAYFPGYVWCPFRECADSPVWATNLHTPGTDRTGGDVNCGDEFVEVRESCGNVMGRRDDVDMRADQAVSGVIPADTGDAHDG